MKGSAMTLLAQKTRGLSPSPLTLTPQNWKARTETTRTHHLPRDTIQAPQRPPLRELPTITLSDRGTGITQMPEKVGNNSTG